MGAKEYALPKRIATFIETVSEANVFRFADEDNSLSQTLGLAPIMSAAAKKLLQGSPWYALMNNWFTASNPQKVPLPISYDAAVYINHCRSQARTLSEILADINHSLVAPSPVVESSHTADTSNQAKRSDAVIQVPVDEADKNTVAEISTAQDDVKRNDSKHSAQSIETLSLSNQPKLSIRKSERHYRCSGWIGLPLTRCHYVNEFEKLLRESVSAIREVPRSRWQWPLFWSEDRNAPDKTYSKIGGFLENFTFNPRRFRSHQMWQNALMWFNKSHSKAPMKPYWMQE